MNQGPFTPVCVSQWGFAAVSPNASKALLSPTYGDQIGHSSFLPASLTQSSSVEISTVRVWLWENHSQHLLVTSVLSFIKLQLSQSLSGSIGLLLFMALTRQVPFYQYYRAHFFLETQQNGFLQRHNSNPHSALCRLSNGRFWIQSWSHKGMQPVPIWATVLTSLLPGGFGEFT